MAPSIHPVGLEIQDMQKGLQTEDKHKLQSWSADRA